MPGDAVRFTHDADDAAAGDLLRRRRGGLLPAADDAGAVRAVIERGERLPRKSTFFWPKPRTGMVLMPVDGPALSPHLRRLLRAS